MAPLPMSSLNQLETCANDLAIAAKTLANHCHESGVGSNAHLVMSSDAPDEAQRARRNVLGLASRLQTLVGEPVDFIQRLASQNQLLACLKWLGEFQVLACIGLNSSVPAKDVADLAGVSETQLCRVVRMTATAGFLQEPQLGHIAHTSLSASFVTKLSYLDASMFLAEVAAPVALQMAAATQRHGLLSLQNESAYNIAFNTSQTFHSACEQRTKLQRQWSAYLRCVGAIDDTVIELLSQLDWRSLGNACVVDVNAHSMATVTALAKLYPALRFVVQISEAATKGALEGDGIEDFDSRIVIQQRTPGAAQTVKAAAVYILRPSAPCDGPFYSLRERILAELRAHLGVLRATHTSVTLVLAPRLLPEPGSVDPEIEAMARLRDLSRQQLDNMREMEMEELIDIVNSVRDSVGSLVVVNKLRSPDNATVALGIRYQTFGDKHKER